MAPFSRRALGICALYGLLSLLFCLPFDTAQHVEYQRLPFWMWQYPQAAILSPAWLLRAILPVSWAIVVNLVLHYWIAFVGMHLLLTRAIGLSFLPGVAAAASIFTLGGAMALHVAAGDVTFLPLCSLPLALFFLYRTTRTGAFRDAWGTAAILALTVYDGGLQTMPIALTILAAWAVCLAIAAHDWRPLALAVLAVACAAAYAGPKLAPGVAFMTSDPLSAASASVLHPDRMTLDMFRRAYIDASLGPHAQVSGAQRHGWWEYGNYLGFLAVIGIAISIVWPFVVPTTRRRSFAIMLALMAAWFLIVSAGEFHAYAPAVMLSELSFLPSIRSYGPYTIGFALFGALALGTMIHNASTPLLTTRWRRIAAGAVAALVIGQLLFVNQRQLRVPTFQPARPDIVQIANVEALRIWIEGPARLSDEVTTFNGARFSVIGGFEPSRVFLNQRYVPGWRSSAGPILSQSAEGPMYVQLAAGQTGNFSISFVPPGLATGLVLLLVGVAASVLARNRRLAPVTYERATRTPRATALGFAARAERASKTIVLWSMVGAVVMRAMVGGANETTLLVIVAASFALGRIASAFIEDVEGIVLASMFVAPAVFARFWVHDSSGSSMYMAAALLGAIWTRWPRDRWSVPPQWRVPLATWALVVAISWPIVALREVDFHPEITGILEMPNSILGISARGAIAIAADAAATLLLGILWVDWLFARYARHASTFRRAIIVPFIACGCLASAIAAYQLFIDISFLNSGWDVFHRASGTMVDANAFGMAAVLCSCACLALIEGRSGTSNRLMIGGFLLTSIGVWASGSRTALVAEVIALVFAGRSVLHASGADDHEPRRFGRHGLVVAAASIAAIVLLWMLRDTGPVLRLGWIVPSASIASVADFAKQMLWVRFGYGTAAIEMIRSSPWFGVGIGAFPLIVGDYPFSHLGTGLVPDNAQNWIRHNLAELGLVGSLAWILWAMVLLVALFRRSGAWRRGSTMIVAGSVVGVVVVSQVGMPTQNAGVAIAFWTFLFWLCACRWPDATPPAPVPNETWRWAATTVLVTLFAAGTLWTSLTTLRPPMRARRAGWNYDYGFYLPGRTPAGEVFRWTKQDAVAVIPAPDRAVRLTVWAEQIDPNHPVIARVWHDRQLVIDTVLHDDRPVSTDLVIDKNPQWLMIRTYFDRAMPVPPQPELGLAVQWTFAGDKE
jgi:O-Antigen ligase